MATSTSPRSSARRAPPPLLTIQEIFALIPGARWIREGEHAVAPCPGHGGDDPNLRIKLGDRCILFTCWSHHCAAEEICKAIGIEVAQTFYEKRDDPWIPSRPRRPRRPRETDAEREAGEVREMVVRWRARAARPRPLPQPINPDRLRHERALVGWIIMGGSRAYSKMPKTTAVRGFMLREVLDAVAVLARHGTPRSWWSPQALWDEDVKWKVALGGGDLAEWRAMFFRCVRDAVAEARRQP